MATLSWTPLRPRTGTSGSTPALITMRRPSGFSHMSRPSHFLPILNQPQCEARHTMLGRKA
jgi:hypothetical protein